MASVNKEVTVNYDLKLTKYEYEVLVILLGNTSYAQFKKLASIDHLHPKDTLSDHEYNDLYSDLYKAKSKRGE